jgi:hypothetical protein
LDHADIEHERLIGIFSQGRALPAGGAAHIQRTQCYEAGMAPLL